MHNIAQQFELKQQETTHTTSTQTLMLSGRKIIYRRWTTERDGTAHRAVIGALLH